MLAYLIFSPTGTLTILHGRVSENDATLKIVRGVAALNIGSPFASFFDCTTSEGTSSVLRWSRELYGSLRFPVTTERYYFMGRLYSTIRMNFAPPNAPVAGYGDVGDYTCTNTATGESISIDITQGTRNDSMYIRDTLHT